MRRARSLSANSSAVFELSTSGNHWTLQLLHEFPIGWGGVHESLTLDTAGNLYDTTCTGGAYNNGNVFQTE